MLKRLKNKYYLILWVGVLLASVCWNFSSKSSPSGKHEGKFPNGIEKSWSVGVKFLVASHFQILSFADVQGQNFIVTAASKHAMFDKLCFSNEKNSGKEQDLWDVVWQTLIVFLKLFPSRRNRRDLNEFIIGFLYLQVMNYSVKTREKEHVDD